jgi:nuclear transcription Y subunit beta
MSASPPKEPDVEQNAQSGEEQEHMDRDQEGTQGLGADFEVKEQDRWLPIANGWCTSVPFAYFLWLFQNGT